MIAAVLVVLIAHATDPEGVLGTVTYLGAIVGAALVAAVVVLLDRRRDRIRILIVLALCASALGDVGWELYAFTATPEPDASLADVGWIAAYLFLGAALILLIRSSGVRMRRDVDAMIDMSVAAVTVALIVWLVWVEPMLTDTSTSMGIRLVWALYPVMDAALLALLARALIRRTVRGRALFFIASGVAMWFVSDLLYLSVATQPWADTAMNWGWMLGSVLLATAVCTLRPEDELPSDVDADDESSADPGEVTTLRVVAAVAPLALPWGVELWAYSRGWDPNPLPLTLASVALGALLCVRAVHLRRLHSLATERLQAEERLYRAAAANSADAALIVSADGTLLREAPGLRTLLHDADVGSPGSDLYQVAERLGTNGTTLRGLLDRAAQQPGVPFEIESTIMCPDGASTWLAWRMVSLLDTPDVHAIMVNLHDVSDRKEVEQELEYQALHDALTGLPNRALFSDRLGHALVHRMRTGRDPVVLFLDLDNFKAANDRLGHDVGDQLLTEVAQRIGRSVRTGDTVARLGGDEFAILVEDSEDPMHDAQAVAERILASFVDPVDLGGTSLTVTASIGLAPGAPGATAASMLRDADTAMYHAKAAGRARYVVYNSEMRERDDLRLRVETDLAGALERGELRVEYQPVVDLLDRRVTGFEALLRWGHPELGDISPEIFIPVAEQAGLISDIGRWVLRTACHQLAEWQREFTDPLSVAVNVSGRQMADPRLPADVRDALDASGLRPTDLVLEITETTIIRDIDEAKAVLDDLRELGIRFAIDDFGTGYSSLSYLQELPVDILKIDRSFVNTIQEGTTLPDIVKGILDLARTLHLQTVAEGIESTAQLDQLRASRCDVGQGFLFARSLRPDAAAELLRESGLGSSPADDERVSAPTG